MKNGMTKCETAFNEAHRDCLRNVHPLWNFVVCAPLKIDFICGVERIFSSESNVCDVSRVIDPNFSIEYARLKAMKKRFSTRYGNASITHATSSELHAAKSINSTTRRIAQTIQEKRNFVDFLFGLAAKFMLIVCLKIVYGELSTNFNPQPLPANHLFTPFAQLSLN